MATASNLTVRILSVDAWFQGKPSVAGWYAVWAETWSRNLDEFEWFDPVAEDGPGVLSPSWEQCVELGYWFAGPIVLPPKPTKESELTVEDDHG